MSVRILVGDCRTRLRELPEQSVQTCVTSPPYFGLRDYGMADQIGLEQTPDAFVSELVSVFREVKRVLRDDGTLWLNLGDSYCNINGFARAKPEWQREGRNDAPANTRNLDALHGAGLKTKDLIGIPWRVAFALQADGWYLRSDIIWHKPNPMPESVTDRPTKSHEYLFLLSKSERYHYDHTAIQEDAVTDDPRVVDGFVPKSANGKHRGDPQSSEFRKQPRFGGTKYGDSDDPKHATKSGNEYEPNGKRNKRTVWTVPTSPYKGAHFATFPPALIEPCIKAGSKAGDVVLDPFGGAVTTGLVADRLGRDAILCELNPEYAKMAGERIAGENPMFTQVAVE
jgi:DNA modification methylase